MENLLTRSQTVYKLPAPRRGQLRIWPQSLIWQTDSRLFGAATWLTGARYRPADNRCITIDLPSGRVTEGGLSPTLRGPQSVSPDGAWMVDASELVRATTLTFTSADGRRKHTWQAQPADKVKDFGVVPDRMFASRVLWLHDGASWLVLIAEQSTRHLWAVTGTPDAPQKARWIDLGKTSDATGGFFFHFSAYDMCDALANLDDDEMVGINASNKLWRFSFRLSQGKASRREAPIPFVDQREYPELRLSPRTGRLAVLSGPWTGVSERDLSLYTMRLDGTERVCLGTVKGDESRRIHGFQWLPSGKSLSFWHNDELRVIDDAPPKPTPPAPHHARRLV